MATRRRRPRWYERDYKPTDPRLWLYGPVPSGFWRSAENRHRYMDWLGQRLGVTHREDWYRITRKTFTANRGRGLLDRFGGSPLAVLKNYQPDYEWLEWRFRKVPGRFWQHRANRRRYLKWLGQQLGFRQREDWYQLSKRQLKDRHGWRLLAMFKGSPSAILKDCFPQHRWLEWRFRHVPYRFWQQRANRQRYLQ